MTSDSERSRAVFPSGSNGEFGLPPELSTVIASGEGCELRDTSGRRFLDFSMGWGSVLVGHARPEVTEAVLARAPAGANFSYVNDESLALAEEIVSLSPACERLRFAASGTEATMYCARLARAFTGRDKILKFEGAYHGSNELGVLSLFPAAPPDYPRAQATSAGVPARAREEVLVAPFNDLETTRSIVAGNARELAAIIVEPLQRCCPPRPGFLEGLRELTREHELLLIFDEVVTGFRLAYGGAQEYYGVVPDLVAYGKALGGGYPIGVFGGRAEILNLVREERLGEERYVWTAATLGGHAVSCAAARAALGVYRSAGTYEHLHQIGASLRHGLERELARAAVVAQVLGDGPLAQVAFTEEPVFDYRSSRAGDRARGRRLMLELFRRGIFLNPMGTKLYLSLAHEERHIEEFLAVFRAALAISS